MVIKATPQILQRVSVRWLPAPAYEDSNTVALNVSGYFLDLRVATADGALQWSRAGERKQIATSPCKLNPSKTHAILMMRRQRPNEVRQ